MDANGGNNGMTGGTRNDALMDEAARMLAQRALSALRGPVARGAVPLQALAQALGTSRGVVAREVERRTGDADAPPFDLVAEQIFADRASEFRLRQRLLERLPASVVVPEGTSGDAGLSILRSAIADLLTEAYANPKVRRIAGLGHLLQAAAALALEEDGAGVQEGQVEPGVAEVARRVRARRTEALRESLEVQMAGIRLGLMAVGRRARDGVDLAEVVTHLQCAYDGFVLRHLLDPDTYPLARFVDMVWALVTTLTVPADAAPDGGTGGPDDATGTSVGAPGGGPDPEQLAAARLADALAPVAEISRIGNNVPGVSAKLAASVLELVTNLADTHPELVTRQPDDTGWHPTVATLAHLLASEYGLDEEADAVRTADLLIDQARQGTPGRDAWMLALRVLGTRTRQA